MQPLFERPSTVRLFQAVLALLALFLLVITVNEFRTRGEDRTDQRGVITVTGDAEVYSAATTTVFSFGVNEESKTAGEAQSLVNRKIDAALKVLRAAGIKDEDIKTVDYSVYPKQESVPTICTPTYCGPSNTKTVGFIVNQSIEVKIKDESKVNDLLAKLTEAGITNLSGLTFVVENEEALQRQARAEAIKEAREQAKALAKDLGVRLGELKNYSENGSPLYYEARNQALDAKVGNGTAPAPQLPRGQNKITSSVTLTFEVR